MFRQYEKNGRVLLPLLSTLDKLLSHEYIDELLCAKSGAFRSNLMACLAKEARGCSDIKRLLAMVGVSLALLQPNHETMSIVRLVCAASFLYVVWLTIISLSLIESDEKRDSPLRHDHATQSLSPCQTLHCRTAVCQTRRRWRHYV